MDIQVKTIDLSSVASYEPPVQTNLGFPFPEGTKFKLADEGTINVKDATGERRNIVRKGTAVEFNLSDLDAERYPKSESKIPHVAIECVDAEDERMIGMSRYVQVSNFRDKTVKKLSDQKAQQLIGGATMDDVFEVKQLQVANQGKTPTGREWFAYNVIDIEKVS